MFQKFRVNENFVCRLGNRKGEYIQQQLFVVVVEQALDGREIEMFGQFGVNMYLVPIIIVVLYERAKRINF